MSHAQKIASVRRSSAYQALITEMNFDDTAALAVLGHTVDEPETDPRIGRMLAKGLTPTQVEDAIRRDEAMRATPAAAPEAVDPVLAFAADRATASLGGAAYWTEPPTALTSKERGDALVEASSFKFTKGRVYLSTDIITATVRVMKTGTPEIVETSGVGYTKAVLLTKDGSDGDVAAQNLTDRA